jgi:energy-coupling factor transporter ATP-binding protein EcfA2
MNRIGKTVTRTLLTVGLSLGLMNSVFSAEQADDATRVIRHYNSQMDLLQERLPRIAGVNKAVLVVGPTGSGKSTFLTWLGGAELTAIDDCGQFSLNGSLGAESDIHISHSGTGTHSPTPLRINTVDGEPIAFWDCPGFGDVRGAEANLVHMISLTEVLKNCEDVKVLCVLNEARCMARNDNVIHLFNQLSELFPDEEQRYRMISLIITGKSVGLNPFMALDARYVKSETGLSSQAKNLLKYLIDPVNRSRTWEMSRPTALGAYTYPPHEFWKAMSHVTSISRPQFRPSLLPDSLFYLGQLSTAVNSQIIALLSRNVDSLKQAILRVFSDFTGSRSDLRESVNAIRGAINRLGDNIDAGEEIIARFAALPGIQSETLRALRLKIEEIKTLRFILGGDLREINGRQISVNYTPHDWLVGGLGSIHTQLNGELLTHSLQQSNERLSQQPRWDTAIPPNFFGFVREEEVFVLPDEDPWNSRRIITVTDVPATHSLSYAHDNEALQSILTNVYSLQRETDQEEPFTVTALDALPYTEVDVRRVAAVPNTLNLAAGNVTLSIHRFYQRADGSPYNPIETLAAHPINRGAVRYDHDDRVLSSRRFVTCSATHEDVAADIGEYPEEARVPYIIDIRNVERVPLLPDTLNVEASTVSIRIRRPYSRPDQTVYMNEEVLRNYPIAKAFLQYAHNDDALRSTEIVRCSTNHEGVILPLGDHMDRGFPYGSEIISERAMAPGTLDLPAGRVNLNIKREYRRIDGTIHNRTDQVINQGIHRGPEKYVAEDANLRSARYVMYRATYGGGDVNLEERPDGYAAYTPGNVLERIVVPGEINIGTRIAKLDIRRAYNRQNATICEKIVRVDSRIIPGQERLVDDDEHLRFIKYVRCSTIYADVGVDLGEHVIETIPYTEERTLFLRTVNSFAVSRTIKDEILDVCRGYEEVFQRFLNGKLIYRPTAGSDVGKIELSIRSLANPLDGTFDLSRCGNAGQYLSISTGYRKAKIAANADKIEVWVVPKFVVKKDIATLPCYLEILSEWKTDAPFGVFWTYGNWNSMGDSWCYSFKTPSKISSHNLFYLWRDFSNLGRRGWWPYDGLDEGMQNIEFFSFYFDPI